MKLNEDKQTILVVDDEREHADGIVEALDRMNNNSIAVYSGKNAVELLRNQEVDVIVTDLKLEDENLDGLRVLQEAKKENPLTEVILITAYATIENCKEAIKQGAYDYLVKPIDIGQLRTLVQQAARKVLKAKQQHKNISRTHTDEFLFDGVPGTSRPMQGIFEILKRVAPTDISVLIEGPSGTGKELLARAIHDNSPRRDMPFRPINCAGLTETLLESELFGHVKGAFTGATNDRKGLFEIADKGTLLLDEIGDMPLSMQAKLLRFLEDGLVVPVGSHKPIKVDVRVISATNHDLTKLIDKNRFRQDLFFRIKGVSISVPPLRERPEDIPELVDYFIEQSAKQTGTNVTGITENAMQILKQYDWPGNIRQLRNCIRTMVVLCERDQLDIQDIPPEIHQVRRLTSGTADRLDSRIAGVSLNELEKQAIAGTLKKTRGNREQAAKILGIGERTLYRKIKEYNL